MADDSEKFEFDVEAGKLKRAIEDVSARLFKLYAEMRKLGRSSEQWSEKQYAEMGQMAQQAAKYRDQMSQLQDRLKSMLGTQQQGIQNNRMYAQSTRDLNVTFLSLGYAIDDFLTVWSMRKDNIEGILAGAGAAANNFSVILAQILPGQTKILAFLPALAVAIAKVGYSFSKTGEDAEDFQKKVEKSVEHLRSLQKELLAFNVGQKRADLDEKKKEDLEQKAFLEKEYEKTLKEKEYERGFEGRFDRRNQWSPERRRQEKARIDREYDAKLIEIGHKIQTIDRAINNREQQFILENQRSEIKAAIDGSGVGESLVAVIRKKLSEGQTADSIIKDIRAKPEMAMFDGLAGYEALQDLVREAQGRRFQARFNELEGEKGPQARRLDEMRMQEEDLRNKIDESLRGAPGEQRAPKRVTARLKQELDALQKKITEQERRAEEEEKLTRDGYFLGDKLDRISSLLASYLRESRAAGVPLANPRD